MFHRSCFVSRYRKKILGEPSGFSQIFGYRKVCIKGRYYNFPRAIFFPTAANNFAGKPFCNWEKIWYQKFSCIGGRGVSRFSVEIFCITVPKHFVGEPFIVSENFWFRNFLCMRGVGVSRFSDDFFGLTEPKLFLEEPFWVSKTFWYRKTLR